jgi:hypothetical protein
MVKSKRAQAEMADARNASIPAPLDCESLRDASFSEMQLPLEMLADVATEIMRLERPRVLVFGLGYDTPVYQHFVEQKGGKLVFVEENPDFIARYPAAKALKITAVDWGTCVQEGLRATELLLNLPRAKLAKLAEEEDPARLAFDLIVVDGPTGYGPTNPGRQGACYWASLLAAKRGIVYVDDMNRTLEQKAVGEHLSSFARVAEWRKEKKHTIKLQRPE